MKVLSDQQLQSYKDHGFLLLRGVVPQTALEKAERVLAAWVDDMAAKWTSEGLLDSLYEEEGFYRRLMVLWENAGKPRYGRSPRSEIVSCTTHELLADPALLDIAEDLIGTPEITVHGVFNARPKCPNQRWTDTPWHQDAQYRGISAKHHVPTFWIPLQSVTESNSCLGVEPDFASGKLFEGYEDETGFLGISPEDRKSLEGVPVHMERGDLLTFTSLTPHHAYTNESSAVRWSMDFRYQSTDTIEGPGKELGFVARSRRSPGSVETCEQWLSKGWADLAW